MDCHDALMLQHVRQHVRQFHPGTKHSAGETHHIVPFCFSQQEISVNFIFHCVVYAVLKTCRLNYKAELDN